MKLVRFVGGHGSPHVGKLVFVNAETVGIVTDGPGSKPGQEVTAIYCGGFPVVVTGSVQDILAALSRASSET